MNGNAAIVLSFVLAASASPAYAQGTANAGDYRIEVSGGAGLLGGADLGSADANLRANSASPQTFRLFATSSDIARAPLWHARAAFLLNPRFAIEGAITNVRPDVRVSATSDAEGALPVTITESIDQFLIDGSVLVMLQEVGIGTRLVPFAAAGGGYLRQLHEGRTLVEHGQVYHVGGGAKYRLLTKSSGAIQAVGLRGDANVYFMRGGISFDDRPRSHLAISGSVFVGF
jgi:hypothetical protein